MYNKETLRKELEDCWDAGTEYALEVERKHWADKVEYPNKQAYITSQLAALPAANLEDDSYEDATRGELIWIIHYWRNSNQANYDRWKEVNYKLAAIPDGEGEECPLCKTKLPTHA